MSKTSKPFLAHSELTDCIYIIDGNDKYEVTEQCISAMKATNRMPNVLDKIRAEIEQMPSELTTDGRRMIRRGSVFRIIEKYKAEGSEEE